MVNATLWHALSHARLQWLPELGVGWYPVTAQPYDEVYFQRYRARDLSPSGAALTAMRIALVQEFWLNQVIDIGIGGGRFVREYGDALRHDIVLGYDVNPAAVAWLKASGLWCDPYVQPVDAVTFWDSLEHIPDPGPLLANVRRFVFASLPIFEGPEDALQSKHYKPEEHCWYFTREGLRSFMRRFGFVRVAFNAMEQGAGREQIESFVFERQW